MSVELRRQNITYNLATSKNASDMVSFHNSYYGTVRKTNDWLWEYRTYDKNKSVFAFATDNGKIIATQGMLPINIMIGSKTVLSGKSESTLLLPLYRGKRVMEQLYDYAANNCIANGMQFIWGFTPAVNAFKKYGFNSHQGIQCMVKRGNIWTAMRLISSRQLPIWRRVSAIGKFFIKYCLSENKLNHKPFHGTAKYELRRGIVDQTCLKAFFDRLNLRNRNAIFIRYDEEYLKWRVREHPFIKYVEYQVYGGNDLKAFAIVALIDGILSISDLTSEDDDATSILLYTIIEDYYKKAMEFCLLVNTQDTLNQGVLKQLPKFGFSARDPWNLIVRDLTNGDIKETVDIRNWHISGLWTEGYSM